MNERTGRWLRRLVLAAGLLFVARAVLELILREPGFHDFVYLLVRWPVWVIVLGLLPLLVLRVVCWRRGPGGRPPPHPGGWRVARPVPHPDSFL